MTGYSAPQRGTASTQRLRRRQVLASISEMYVKKFKRDYSKTFNSSDLDNYLNLGHTIVGSILNYFQDVGILSFEEMVKVPKGNSRKIKSYSLNVSAREVLKNKRDSSYHSLIMLYSKRNLD